MNKKEEKNTAENFFVSFLIKNSILLTGISKVQEKYSSTLLTFSLFVGHFLSSWIRIRIANPDRDTDPETPESNLDPDPQHCS
jgi:hypothetical protein